MTEEEEEYDLPEEAFEGTRPPPQRALILVPLPPGPKRPGEAGERAPEAKLDEAVGLARAIALDIVEALVVPLAAFRPATLFGTGKVEEIAGIVAAREVQLVVVDHPLTPVQQRNLEKEWKAKVIDRTGLILEIFGERARTREGRLQVELAHLTYQRGRLVRSWTHLERQRGGFGFLGGPGETQIEADRRHIQERIIRIERELEQVVKMRRVQRENRRRVSQPVIALVGYTNAGKSTLFNALTKADIMAADLLFATLDPTMRRLRLPHGTEAILSDTVGFIADLPTHLVAAFRATLEEVIEADLILHVRDISHPDSEAEARDVAEVLEQLGIDPGDPDRIIEVWNKIDRIPGERRPAVPAPRGSEGPLVVAVSALTGEGIDRLLGLVEDRLAAGHRVFRVELAGPDLARLHQLYEMGEVLERVDGEDGTVIARARVSDRSLNAFRKAFPGARKAE